nr:hypothetical protein [Tanacetum cinerariifolium]
MVDNILFTKKSKSHLIIVQIYVDAIIFVSTSQDLCDDFAKIMHDEFEMSMMGESNFFLGLQIKQMEDKIFFNQSKYIKEMLKKFGLEDSKPTKTLMSTKIKLTKDDEADFMDSSKYRETNGPCYRYDGSRICLRRKACQQALWMKQALIDYGIRLDNVPIMSDNKGTKMPSEYQQDYKKTLSYAPKLYNDPNMSDSLRDIYRALESRYVHEGRTIEPSFYNDLIDYSLAKFTAISFNCLLSLDEKICPRPCELVIRENVYSAIGNRDHTQAVIALMFYCLENRQPFNLSYFIVKKIYLFRDRRDKVLPYGMILTRLFEILKASMAQGSFDERYKLIPRKMPSLKAKQLKRPPAQNN